MDENELNRLLNEEERIEREDAVNSILDEIESAASEASIAGIAASYANVIDFLVERFNISPENQHARVVIVSFVTTLATHKWSTD